MLRSQHEQQLSVFLQHQLDQQRRREELTAVNLTKERENKFRLDVLKQKDKTTESAVASPEVKRRLQEVILQRKRREAAASMGNLQICVPSGVSTAAQPPTALLRKVQSESNLLKIKTKRDRSSAPYSTYARGSSAQLQLVPEMAPVNCSEAITSTASTPSSNTTAQTSVETSVESCGSNPASPASSLSLTTSLAGKPVNSKSLPNIPSSLETSRRSPPATSTNLRMNQRRNPLEKSHSYAILPLRLHLMHKSLAERRSIDDNQYSYLKDKMERERLSRQRLVRPLEEVMEEDQTAKAMEEMEVEDTKESQQTQHLPQNPSEIPLYAGQSPLLTAVSQQPASLKTGIGFHSAMLGHQCHCDDTRNHPEKPERFVLSREEGRSEASLSCFQTSVYPGSPDGHRPPV